MVDEALALHEVREFAARVQTADDQRRPSLAHLDDPAHKSFVEAIHKQLPLTGFETPGKDGTSAYEGSRDLGLACAKLVRNLATHNGTAQRDESELLEELAMLSRFARIVDSSTV